MRGDAIRLGNNFVYDFTQNEIPENIFSREELCYDELILEREIESSDDESEFNETHFIWGNFLWFIIYILNHS